MAYVRKFTTLTLIFVLLITIGVFSYAMVFYQQSLTKLNGIVDARTAQIRELSDQLNKLNTEISNLNQILDIQLLREENLSDQYTTLKLEKAKIVVDQMTLEDRLNLTQTELDVVKNALNLLGQNLTSLEGKYQNLETEHDKVLEDLQDICDDAAALNISECGDYN